MYTVDFVLTVVFIVLKLVGTINWSWWWVFSPTWIVILLIFFYHFFKNLFSGNSLSDS